MLAVQTRSCIDLAVAVPRGERAYLDQHTGERGDRASCFRA